MICAIKSVIGSLTLLTNIKSHRMSRKTGVNLRDRKGFESEQHKRLDSAHAAIIG